MENSLLSKTFKIFHDSQDNTIDIMEDPINQINQSLNNLLINLNSENQNKYGYLGSDLYLESKQTNKDDCTDEDEEVEKIFNSYKLQDNCINNMSNYNLIDNISKKDNKDNLSRNIITPSNQFFFTKTIKKKQ